MHGAEQPGCFLFDAMGDEVPSAGCSLENWPMKKADPNGSALDEIKLAVA